MQEWKKREKKTMTQDTEVKVAGVNRGMSIRRSKKKSNLLNDARIKACISGCTHAFSFYAPSATALDRTLSVKKTAVRSRTSMMMTTMEEEVSVDSGDDQPSADVGSLDLCEVCMVDARQALVPCGHQRFRGSGITEIEDAGRGWPMCRAPITMILRLF